MREAWGGVRQTQQRARRLDRTEGAQAAGRRRRSGGSPEAEGSTERGSSKTAHRRDNTAGKKQNGVEQGT